jgi:hypothetical protein
MKTGVRTGWAHHGNSVGLGIWGGLEARSGATMHRISRQPQVKPQAYPIVSLNSL